MLIRALRPFALALLLAPAGCLRAADPPLPGFSVAARWDQQPEASAWTEATVAALKSEGAVLVDTVPEDIGAYCPGYARARPDQRRAFWVGLLSSVAKHESGWNPGARGGGGRFLGLMQISDGTAEANGCARGAALLDGGANMACAVRIVANQVARDGALFGGERRGWLGLARDWLPLRDRKVRQDITDWTKRQAYCR
jgi:Transglycosylase SLT domain